jgi:rhodanese-related sulfurtransferase
MSGAISPEALSRQIAEGTAPAILDVRSSLEYAAGHVPGAIHVPFWQIGRRWRNLAHLRDRPVVIYCGHGPRAYIAGGALERRGFSAVAYLTGHMKRWKELNLPLEPGR